MIQYIVSNGFEMLELKEKADLRSRVLGMSSSRSFVRIIALAAAGSSLLYLKSADSGNYELLLSRLGPLSSGDAKEDASGNVGDGSKSVATAAAMVLPALVYISVWWMDGKTWKNGAGSGTIIDSDGTILTCAHLLSGTGGERVFNSIRKVDVTLQDGRTFVGTVLNEDIHSDIAILKITSTTPFPPAKLGSSCKLHPGDWVVAMGSPRSLKNTVTAGIVSCVGRKSSELGIGGMLREYIQTDCAINPGNSGGPLVNLDGEVVAVNIFSRAAATGLHFAVPIDSVSRIMEHFRKNGRVIRPWLGLKMLDLNGAIITQLKDRDPMFANISKGVLIFMVTPGSPADLAGLRPGDVVVKFHGTPVGSITEITELMGDKVGMPFKVVVKRALITIGVSGAVQFLADGYAALHARNGRVPAGCQHHHVDQQH
ncbi:hypothetical protein RJ639_044860 [Escallonia herrerae]|uniref:PDZ domain-containing protein n=1 Tax=Escallonia herrerae TaxID=1293975 RepID=A0AA88WJ59_9ASTE|nr:hypothetical protein RJ639_044860 [Escallonia herrerae]